YRLAYEDAVTMTVGAASLKVISPCWLAMLKLKAYTDTPERTKDLVDVYFIIDHYLDFIDEDKRLYGPDATDADVAVEGVMDLVVFGDDFNLVIDYKTDMFKDPEIHRRQVQTYVRVAEEVFGKKCYGTLYYLRDGSSPGFWDRDGKVSTSVFS
ncbi:MAG: hypothetical protein IIU49_04030, partial [Spirochaetales bacterium]|nr:hypothetical protein [Spirochaetales bacterium]